MLKTTPKPVAKLDKVIDSCKSKDLEIDYR
jgi:hypothetical protein